MMEKCFYNPQNATQIPVITKLSTHQLMSYRTVVITTWQVRPSKPRENTDSNIQLNPDFLQRSNYFFDLL